MRKRNVTLRCKATLWPRGFVWSWLCGDHVEMSR